MKMVQEWLKYSRQDLSGQFIGKVEYQQHRLFPAMYKPS